MSATILPFIRPSKHNELLDPNTPKKFNCTCNASPEIDKTNQKRIFTVVGWVCSICHRILTEREIKDAESEK